jgi:ATP-binding cassette subfamily B protein
VPLIETLPKPLEDTIAASRNGDADELVIAVAADLTRAGRFGEEWLVVTKDRLRVYEPNGARPTPRLDVPLTELKSPATDSLVGGAALQATIDGERVEIIRFTNAKQRDFSRITKYLGDVAKYHETIAKGEEVKEEPTLAEDAEGAKRCPTCSLLLPEGTKVCPACLNKGKVLRRILVYLRPYWRQTVTVWVLMIVSTGLTLVPPLLNRPLMDVVLAPKHNVLPVADRLMRLGWLALELLLIQAAIQAVGIIRGRLVVFLSSRLSHDLRTQLYQHLQLLSLKFFDKRQTGAVMARVTQDTQELQYTLMDGAQFFVVNLLVLFGIGIVLFVMNWRLTLLILIPAPIVALMSRFFWSRMFRRWNRYWHFRQRLSATLNDSLSGIRVVRAFAQEGQEVARFNRYSHDMFQAGMSAEQTWITYFPILSFVISTGTVITWYVGGRQVVGDEMSLGTLITFLAYLGTFYGPLQFLSRLADWLARALASAERIFEIIDSDPDVPEAEEPVPMPRIDGRVSFDDVTFGYDRHKPVLRNVGLDVAQGEMIGFVGHSGAGKSTTINLICRFYDVNEGRILIDGVDIRKIPQQDLRSQIGVVLQDTFLFSGTICDNIGYAKPGATVEEIMAAAKAANAHDFICQKPDGYDTQVGERGQSLSGGERQRISIARAILHNPRILILDEATSSVDTDTEKQIQDAIARLIKGRTTFAIAHRLSTLRNANRLVVLKEGKVEEVGTHDELMEKKGEFYRLVGMQQEMSQITGIAG